MTFEEAKKALYDNYEAISRRDWQTGEAIFITFPEGYATITSTINTDIELDEDTAFGKEPEKAYWFIYRGPVLYNGERAFLKKIMEAIDSLTWNNVKYFENRGQGTILVYVENRDTSSIVVGERCFSRMPECILYTPEQLGLLK